MASNRVQKVNQLFQEELAESIRKRVNQNFNGVLVSVTAVSATPDLSIAKIYVSIFPNRNKEEVFLFLKNDTNFYRNILAQSVANSMRKVPELNFYLDESIEKAEGIDRALRGDTENPIL